MWISVLGWTWRDGSKGRAVNGLSGVAPMVYFHFFTAAPGSQLSWLGATLFITGIFVLFRFRPRPYIARASHDSKAYRFVQADASRRGLTPALSIMTNIEESTECSKCGSLIDTSKDTDSERAPCQNCGSISRLHTVNIVEKVLAVDGYGVIGKRPGKKKPFVEEMSMPEYSFSKEKIVHKYRLIDRDNDKYAEKISDYQSGEIIHQCEELLTEHFDHGSAKFKINKEKN